MRPLLLSFLRLSCQPTGQGYLSSSTTPHKSFDQTLRRALSRDNDNILHTKWMLHSQKDALRPKLHQVCKHESVHPRFSDPTQRRQIWITDILAGHERSRDRKSRKDQKWIQSWKVCYFKFWKGILHIKHNLLNDFACESGGDTINTVMAGWRSGTSSEVICQI